MSREIYRTIYEKVLLKESRKSINLCCVCLQTIFGDDMKSIHDEAEFILNSRVVVLKLSQVLTTLIGNNFSDVLMDTICNNCNDAALTSYSFILKAKESANTLYKAIQDLEVCFIDTPDSIIQKYKTMYVDINYDLKNHSIIKKRYADKKHNKSVKRACGRTVTIEQHQKPVTNDLISQGTEEEPLSDFGSDHDLERNSSIEPKPENLQNKLMSKRFKYFNCPDCNAGFNSPECYEKHRTTLKKCTKWNRGYFPCDQCNFSTVYKHNLKSHIDYKHKGIGVVCDICGKICRTASILKTHLISHSEEKKFQCQVCGQKLKSALALKIHTSAHTGVNNYPCYICGERFRNANIRSRHVKRQHIPQDPEQPKQEFDKPITNLVVAEVIDDSLSEKAQNLSHKQENVKKRFKYFNCPDCNAGFNSPELFERHKMSKKKCTTRNRGTFICDHCNFSAVYKHQLQCHIQLKHFGVVCEECGKSFISKRALKAHQLNHNKESEFVCKVCGKKLRSAMSLKNHSSLHTGEKNYPCHVCGKRFRYQANRSEHVQRHHLPQKPMECDICHKKYKFAQDCLKHRRKHFSENGSLLVYKTFDNRSGHVKLQRIPQDPKQCNNDDNNLVALEGIDEPITNLVKSQDKDENILGFESDQVIELKASEEQQNSSHQQQIVLNVDLRASEETQDPLHQQEKVLKEVPDSQILKRFKFFNCPDCNAGFNSPELYQRHKMSKKKCTKRNRGYFPCDQCSYSAVYKRQLNNHIKLKHKGMGLVCEECGKSFLYKRALEVHQLNHSDESKFVCLVCGKKLSSAISLRDHIALHTGEKNYPCHICGERFRSMSNRREHVQRHHLPQVPAECDICQKTFKHKLDYQKHKRKHYSKVGVHLVDKTSAKRRYPCGKCGFRAFNKKELRQHTSSAHGDK